MGLREQSIVGNVPEFVYQCSVAQVLVRRHKQFINNFFPSWACAAGFNNNNYSFFSCPISHTTLWAYFKLMLPNY